MAHEHGVSSASKFNLKKAISRQTDSSMMLAKHIIATDAKDKNFVFSPVSINIVLSMVAAGSKDETLDEFLGFLKSTSLDELGKLVSKIVSDLLVDELGEHTTKLAVANGIWIDRKFRIKEKFEQVIGNVYKGNVKQVDFTEYEKCAKEVNLWAEEKTNGIIKDILPVKSNDKEIMLILANAIHFKGSWMEPFDPLCTKDHPFHLLSGIDVQAPFMTIPNSSVNHYIAEFDGFKVLRLQYEYDNNCTNRFSMYIFLPDANDGLPELVEKLDSGSAFLDKHIPKKSVKRGEFRIPKFKISYQFEASETLQNLGLVSPFTLPNDLTEIVDSPLIVSKVHHKAYMEVNEHGTEAAAVTCLEIESCGCSRRKHKTIDFVADHPFLFMIRENLTGLVLFVGQILNPLET